MYGVGCLERCGYCLNEKGCDYVNGICFSGCGVGYYGFWCKIGRLNNIIYIVVF